ncbi:S41 family peptidase [Cellvibrio mixtus]|uniref:S41 family peptidase n=1 Tax=Cellvibrio mixtus TaxID=39650 RepID=UPI00069399D2|nr:S41 family peptidase [Cellvibrio mixtus]
MNESSLLAKRANYLPSSIKPTLSLLSAGVLALTLAACGGGGGDSRSIGNNPTPSSSSTSSTANSGWVAGAYKSASTFDNLCAVPRTGFSKFTGIAFPDKKGTSLDEKNFLRSWSHETYLWFEELPDLNPGNSDTPQTYFSKLKTNKTTSSGTAKDAFHFYEPTEDAESWESGITYGYGIHLKVYSTTPPRGYFVAYVEPGSPAANAGIARGAKILKIDSYDLVNENSEAGLNALSEGLFPSLLGAAHNFEIQDAGTVTSRTVTIQSAEVNTSPVLLTKILETATGKVGYVVFNSHVEKAEDQWVKAIQQLKQSAVSDVILDLRYNGGGLLSIASEVSYMLAGANVQGKVFYEQIQNSKQPKLEPMPFWDVGYYGNYKNLDLPTLDLKRVYILSSGDTCSASEAIINGLRGANIPVYLIGDTTCGKPYGFYPEENCGTTYYTIQLKGANAKGFGEYSDGFVPSSLANSETLVQGCRVQDDIARQLGDTSEALLATALNFRANGSCSIRTSGKLQKQSAEFVDGELVGSEIRKLLILK